MHEIDRWASESQELTRKSPYSWWTRWLRQTLRLRHTSPCTEEPKRTPWDSDVEAYLWHGRNHPCPIWALAPRPTLPWLPMWDIPFPFKRLHDLAAGTHLRIIVTLFTSLYNAVSKKQSCQAKDGSHCWCNVRLTFLREIYFLCICIYYNVAIKLLDSNSNFKFIFLFFINSIYLEFIKIWF